MLDKLYKDEVNTKRVSNLFLTSQFEMRTGQFEASLESINKTIDLAWKVEKDFGADMDIVLAKFSMQKANVAFLLKDFETAKTFADKCLSSVDRVDVDDAQIMKQM